MQFVVTYKDSTGSQATMTIEAASRAEAFAELRTRGISPISVEQRQGKSSFANATEDKRGTGKNCATESCQCHNATTQQCNNGSTTLPNGAIIKPYNKRLFYGCFIAVVAVFTAIWLYQTWSAKQKSAAAEAKKQAKIEKRDAKKREAKPQVAKVETEAPKELPPQKVGETRNGYILLPSGRLHKVKGVITNSVSATQFKGKYEIFDHHCENEIACLLTMQPGEGLVGTPRYNGRFKAEFIESLKTPIIIHADDTPEDKALKQNMIQTKMDLKDAMDRGEDIEQIMLDTRREYQDLARYKMELQGLVNEFKRGEGVTDEDVEDYIKAANKMLESKGIAPLKLGPISRQKIRMMRQQQAQ